MTGYRTVCIDPPWPQKGGGTLQGRKGWHDSHGASRAMGYDLMSVPEIAAMPIRDLVDPVGAHLYMWTTNGFLPAAFDVLRAWGFTYSTTLVWGKRAMGGGLGGAYGISTEFVLFARRGVIPEEQRKARVKGTWWVDDQGEDEGALWQWKRPYDERGKPRHSAKPPEFYANVERASPGPYLELFAREPRHGWDVWGNQAPGCVDLPALASLLAPQRAAV